MARPPGDLEQNLRSMILGNIRVDEPQPQHGRHASQGPPMRGPPLSSHPQQQQQGMHPRHLGQWGPQQHHHAPHHATPQHGPNGFPGPPPGFHPSHAQPQAHPPQGQRAHHPHGQPSAARGQRHSQPAPVRPLAQQPRGPSFPPASNQPQGDAHAHWRSQSTAGPRGRGSDLRGRGGMPRSSKPSTFKPLARPPVLTREELSAQSAYLQSMAEAELPSMQMSDDEWSTKDKFRVRLEELCRETASKHYPESFPVELPAFGSFASTFGMPGSDMDLALVAPQLPDFPRHIERTLLDAGLGARLLTRTRVPILKICEKPTPELQAALLTERQKWDEMTPEEREEHDHGPSQRKDEPKPDAKDNVPPQQTKLGACGPDANECTTATKSNTSAPVVDSSVKVTNLVEAKQSSLESPISPETPNKPDASFPADAKDAPTATNNKDNKARSTKPWLREKPMGPLDFPKSATAVGIQCDINFSTTLGIHNTALLRCYSATDPRVRPLVLFVKRWASRRKINSGYNGTLSSYGYVLMALHFLANVATPPVAPNLQIDQTHTRPDARSGLRHYRAPDARDRVDGCDVRFWRNEAQIRARAAQGLLSHNRDALGHLLRNFFVYYAAQGGSAPAGGFSWMHDVLSLRSPGGLLTKAEKGWTGARTTEAYGGREVRHRYLLAIEDPFELEHNVARTVTHNGIVAIRDEFRRVARILERVGHGQANHEGDLLEQLVEKALQQPDAAPSMAAGASSDAQVAQIDGPPENTDKEGQKGAGASSNAQVLTEAAQRALEDQLFADMDDETQRAKAASADPEALADVQRIEEDRMFEEMARATLDERQRQHAEQHGI